MTPADKAQLLMWRIMVDADAVEDWRAVAHRLLELAERLAAEGDEWRVYAEWLRSEFVSHLDNPADLRATTVSETVEP